MEEREQYIYKNNKLEKAIQNGETKKKELINLKLGNSWEIDIYCGEYI